MSIQYEEPSFDFDFDFLNPGSNISVVSDRTEKPEKSRKAILIVKKKIVATDSLIRRYYDKKEEVEQFERTLQTSKDECKQTCLELKNISEKYVSVEKEVESLRLLNAELCEKYNKSENQRLAIQSHANQLQTLVNENQNAMDSLKIENELQQAIARDCEKKVITHDKEKADIIKDICLLRNIILGKKKLNKHSKLVLHKYEKYVSDHDSILEEDSETDLENNCALSTQINILPADATVEKNRKGLCGASKDDNDHDSDCSNELASRDTGRGSSLAFSDKCFNSPDYFLNHSPMNTHSDEKRICADMATSPIAFSDDVPTCKSPVTNCDTIQIILSPINTEEEMDRDSPIESELLPPMTDNENIDVPLTNSLNDKAIIKPSPCKKSVEQSAEVESSSLQKTCETKYVTEQINIDVASSSPALLDHNILSNSDTCNIKNSVSEKECLEQNNSTHFNEKNTGDREIEMILNEMRFNRTLITPIPSTPSKSRHASRVRDKGTQISTRTDHVCKEAALAREENKRILVKYNKLEQEMAIIKDILSKKLGIANFMPSPDLTVDKEVNHDSVIRNAGLNDMSTSDPIPILVSEPLVEESDSTVEEVQSISDYSNTHNSVSLVTNSPQPVNSKPKEYQESNNIVDFVETEKLETNVFKKQRSNACVPNNLAPSKYRKLSKLEKLRKSLAPKSKIKREIPLILKKKRFKSSKLPTLQSTQMEESDTAAIVSNKHAYEKDEPSKHMEEVHSKETHVIESKNFPFVLLEDVVSPKKNVMKESPPTSTRKRQKRDSTDHQDVPCKRVLRSSRQSTSDENGFIIPSSNVLNTSEEIKSNDGIKASPISKQVKPIDDQTASPISKEIKSNYVYESSPNSKQVQSKEDAISKEIQSIDVKSTIDNRDDSCKKNLLSYGDLDLFSDHCKTSTKHVDNQSKNINPTEIIFCAMLDKYGKQSKKTNPNKLPESMITSITNKIQDEINKISHMNAHEAKDTMDKLVETIQDWDFKAFMTALMAYLQDPQRKVELYNKINSPPAPPMTKSEQILLYVILQLRVCYTSFDALNCVLCNVEYILFKLNRTPEFDTIETMAHFYAVLCRYFKMKSRLRLFMLDAMYCMQFKAVPLIKQCLDVWMHVLPLAHMRIAKSPLVTCLVYLLHFYKCEDRFNRVQDIRNILSRKYFYEITEWNEPKIIEMIRNAIKEVRAIPVEMKLLRIALIVISKRHGPKWCQKNIINNVLMPMIEKDVSEKVKIFCISLLGPLLKPYPVDMKVHCEIVINLLFDKLNHPSSPAMEEAIMTSLIYLSKHNHGRLLQALLCWRPQKVSPQMEATLRDFVMEKPLKVWKSVLSKIHLET